MHANYPTFHPAYPTMVRPNMPLNPRMFFQQQYFIPPRAPMVHAPVYKPVQSFCPTPLAAPATQSAFMQYSPAPYNAPRFTHQVR